MAATAPRVVAKSASSLVTIRTVRLGSGMVSSSSWFGPEGRNQSTPAAARGQRGIAGPWGMRGWKRFLARRGLQAETAEARRTRSLAEEARRWCRQAKSPLQAALLLLLPIPSSSGLRVPRASAVPPGERVSPAKRQASGQLFQPAGRQLVVGVDVLDVLVLVQAVDQLEDAGGGLLVGQGDRAERDVADLGREEGEPGLLERGLHLEEGRGRGQEGGRVLLDPHVVGP